MIAASVLIVLVELLFIGMGGIVVCLLAYISWVIFRDERKYRQELARERQRRDYWGYE